jgi:uncharacterized protein
MSTFEWSLIATAFWMGMAGGLHCISMCSAPVTAVVRVYARRPQSVALSAEAAALQPCTRTEATWDGRFWRGMALFLSTRTLSYATFGVLIAWSMQGLGWLTVHSPVFRTLWSFLHVAVFFVGVWMVFAAQSGGRWSQWALAFWRKLQTRFVVLGSLMGEHGPTRWTPRQRHLAGLGLLWGFMPCGLLYSALLTAALTPRPLSGALVMAAFALGSAGHLLAGPWLFGRLRALGDGAWGLRLAGLALAGASAWALWLGLVHQQAPWC